MGDINFDLSKEPRFRIVPYACAAIGAAAGVMMTSAVTVPGMIAAGAIGAVAGGIGLPVVGVVAAIGGVAIWKMGKALVDTIKKEGPMLPLGMAVVGLSAAKTLFVSPFTEGWKLAKKLKPGKKPNDGNAPPASADSGDAKSKLDGKTSGKDFKAAAKKDAAPNNDAQAKPAPKQKKGKGPKA